MTNIFWKIIFLAFFFISVIDVANAQINGRVEDNESGQPIPGAVIEYDSGVTISDPNGYFTLNKKDLNNDTLHLTISHIGYIDEKFVIPQSRERKIFMMIPDISKIDEVIITSPVFSVSLKSSTNSVNLLSSSYLEDQNSINIADELNTLPGIFMAEGAYTTNRLTIRGVGSRTPYASNRITAYLDNIPLTSGEGITSIEDIDINGLGRIEVLKGPYASVYGSGLGGIIKLHLKQPTMEGFRMRVASEAGSFKSFRNSANATYRKNDKSVLVSYTNTQSEGFRENSEYVRNSAFFKITDENPKSKISLSLNYTDVNAEIPSSISEEDFLNDPDAAAANWLEIEGFEKYKRLLAGLNIDFTLTSSIKTKITVFSVINDAYESRPFNILDDGSFNTGIRNQWIWEKNRFNFQLGGEFFYEEYTWKIHETNNGDQGELLNENNESRNYFNLFANSRFDISDRLFFETGVNFNSLKYSLDDIFNTQGIDQSADYKYDPVFSPRIGLNYMFLDGFHLFMSAGHGFSAPSVEETLLPEGDLNTELKPETGWNYEVGSRGHLWNYKLFYDLTFYHIRIKNMLVTKREAEDIFTAINAGKTIHTGLELYLRYNQMIDYKLLNRINLWGSFSISENQFVEFVDDGIDHSGNQLPGIPSNIFHSGLTLKLPFHIEFDLEYRRVGAQFMNDANTLEYESYELVHTKLSYEYKHPERNFGFNVYAKFKNIFDTKHASMILVNAPSFGGRAPRYYYPGNPRMIFLGTSLNF